MSSKETKDEKISSEKQVSESVKSNDLEILIAKEKKYKVGNKVLIQRPLVMRDFMDLYDHITEMFVMIASSNPELVSGKFDFERDGLNPKIIIGMIQASKDAMDKLLDIIAVVLKEDKEFLLDNIVPSMFIEIVTDMFILNELMEIVKNFQIAGHRIKSQLTTV